MTTSGPLTDVVGAGGGSGAAAHKTDKGTEQGLYPYQFLAYTKTL